MDDYYDYPFSFDYEELYTRIDSVEVTVSIDGPAGPMAGADIHGGTASYAYIVDHDSAPENEDGIQDFLLDLGAEFVIDTVGYPLKATLSFIKFFGDFGTNSEGDKFTSTSSANSHTWKMDYGTHSCGSDGMSNGKDEFSTQIRFTPDWDYEAGDYKVKIQYKVKTIADVIKHDWSLLYGWNEGCSIYDSSATSMAFEKTYTEEFQITRINL